MNLDVAGHSEVTPCPAHEASSSTTWPCFQSHAHRVMAFYQFPPV